MDIPSLEARQVVITSGSSPSAKIENFAEAHPFTQQLDIVFPATDDADVLKNELSTLETVYGNGTVRICEIFEESIDESSPEKAFMALSTGTFDQDAWCIDHRGLLTLCVTKETYERLGLVGTRLPFKNHEQRYVIRTSLRKGNTTPKALAKTKEALKSWDARREQEGCNGWESVFSITDAASPFVSDSGHDVRSVRCQVLQLNNVHVPVPTISSPPASEPEEGLQVWQENVESLFEWVGMAVLGSQRLQVNDRVDPYVAVYEPPTNSQVGSVMHLQWKGFLAPGFVQSVINIIFSLMASSPHRPPFVSITGHAILTSPVSYIPHSKGSPAESVRSPLRVPRPSSEDTWSLILTPPGQTTSGTKDGTWIRAESVGQWDKRWG